MMSVDTVHNKDNIYSSIHCPIGLTKVLYKTSCCLTAYIIIEVTNEDVLVILAYLYIHILYLFVFHVFYVNLCSSGMVRMSMNDRS